MDSQLWVEPGRKLTVTRTLSGTTLGEKKAISKSSTPTLSRKAARPMPTSHRLARNNDAEGIMNAIEQQGLWKGACACQSPDEIGLAGSPL